MEFSLPSVSAYPWNELAAKGQPVEFKKGQVLFYEGHIPNGVFLIVSGAVGFEKMHGACAEDHLLSVPEGNVVGLGEVLGATPSCCTSVAHEDSRTIFISKSLLTEYHGQND